MVKSDSGRKRNRVKVKICGITNLEDALACRKLDADALGFVFYKKSSRYINPQAARDIIKHIPARVLKVGVFVDAKEETIKNIANSCGLDILQFHGRETPGFCNRFKGDKVIKAFRIKDRIDLSRVKEYKTFAVLFDAFVKALPGGTGRSFDWGLLKQAPEAKKPVFLSGGLDKNNVRKAISSAGPDWVDVSTSVEASPGRKDPEKVRKFIRAAKS